MILMGTTRRPPIIALVIALATLAALVAAGGAQAQLQPTATHWCRGGDPPLHASRETGCDVAIALVNSLFNGPQLSEGGTRTMSVQTPTTHKSYRLELVRRGDHIVATGANGIWIRFEYEG